MNFYGRPLDRRQARLLYQIDREDGFAPVRRWPQWARNLFFSEHRKRPARFQFARFLLANGASPDFYRRWMLAYDVDRRGLGVGVVSRGYSPKAKQQLLDLLSSHTTGELYQRYPYELYDINERTVRMSHNHRLVRDYDTFVRNK